MELAVHQNFMWWNFHINNRKKIKNICLMLLPLFLMSCLNKDNNIVSLLKEWEQKEILFPKEMYFTTMLRDTTYYNLQSEYKILAYVDSIGCTSYNL